MLLLYEKVITENKYKFVKYKYANKTDNIFLWEYIDIKTYIFTTKIIRISDLNYYFLHGIS